MKEKWKDPRMNPNLSSKDKRFLELARRQALKSSFAPKRVGVVIVKGNRIIAEGHNYLSHTKQLNFPGIDGFAYWSLHAEAHALAATPNVRKATIYLYGLKKGRPSNSAPCPLCSIYLEKRGIRRVVHTSLFGGVVSRFVSHI